MDNTFYYRLSQGPLLADGGIGTELHRRGSHSFDECLEQLNLNKPELVRQVHLDYLEAGAELIETNSFGANRVRLGRHGLADYVQEINRRAVELVRDAQSLTGQRVWIAGAVGPLGKPLAPLWPIFQAEARAAFQEQVQALVDAGVDLLILETFPSLAELCEAIDAARSVSEVPIVAQLTFTLERRTLSGDTVDDVVTTLAPLDLAAIGANCSVGPDPMLSVIEEMAARTDTPLSALPNAGFPTYINGRFVYLSSPSYMAGYASRMLRAGVGIIGGCCGTTPEHIIAMRDVLRNDKPEGKAKAIRSKITRLGKPQQIAKLPAESPTGLAKKLEKRFVVTVEVHPPRGFDVGGIIGELRNLLQRVNVDAFNATDSPMAQGRMSALAMSTLIQSRLGVEAILHIAARYRNLLALHSDLLGAHGLGIRNVFVIMGNPPSMGDYPGSISLSDVMPSELIRLIAQANKGVDLSGRSIERPTSFLTGCAFNLSASNMDRELRSLERKVTAGADFILTQAVFDPEVLEMCYNRLGGFPLPVVMGVLPLRSFRHAEFLHNEVPGMVIPRHVRQRLHQAGLDGPKVGVALAQELLQAVHPKISGVYLIPAFGRYDSVADILEGLPELGVTVT